MRYLLIIIFTLFGVVQVYSQTIDLAGTWSTANVWVGNTLPTLNSSIDIDTKNNGGGDKFQGGEVSTVDGDYTIGNMTWEDQTLTVSNPYTLNLGSQTLFDANPTSVKKNFIANNNSTINVPAGATMIIYGDLDVKNGLTLNIQGTFIVKGDFVADNNAAIVVAGGGSIGIDGDLTLGGGTTSISGPPGSITVGGTCTAGNGACGSAALPIELLSFIGTELKGKVSLKWSTGSEVNNDYFTIERSSDGLNYQSIATIGGAGNSSEALEYQYVDKDPLFGRSYYRLKQTDFDGASEVFAPIAVDFTSLSTGDITFTNPVMAGEEVTVYLNTDESENLKLSIFNMVGEKIIDQNFSGVSYSFQLSADVKPGIYFLKVSSSSTEKTGRLVVN
ncbi:T9SS type A sorting domain-containing protein [Fulvivirga lutimaris]|uniref:T9SS type A sorting domain-containing protein n=1 Tax=Fulvivirga lutimaris TaxID=1819566 RepID=UPI0012BBFCD1|nr:T9SS type A sorting domain-containing protein [Fulvivirga lutimaris]MTI39977.1 T9SS type A sorting domain-containing protein [Fulvivirga lutimaris]